MKDTDEDEQPRQPVPRAWREEFDGIKPIRPIVYRKPAPKADEAASSTAPGLTRLPKRVEK